MNESGNGGMILIGGKSKNPDVKTSPIDTFPITNFTWTDLVKNPGLRVKESTTVRPHELYETLSLYYVKNQQDATLAVLFISYCKITLHVSDAFCVHHQEY